MQSRFRVQVSKDYLVFASAHFITFRGHQCETLHGHNYRVGVAVEGSVDGGAFTAGWDAAGRSGSLGGASFTGPSAIGANRRGSVK